MMCKRTTPILLVILLAAIAVLPAGAITWGEEDTTHLNVGGMVVYWPDYGPWLLCSGTLIHPRVFLTAGHCTDALIENGIEQVWVNFEPYALTESGFREVVQAYTHPDYAWGGDDMYDVGLLVLADEVTDITPAQLPAEGFLDALKRSGELRTGPDGAKFTVVGYGGTLSWPPHVISYDDTRRFAVSEYIALTKTTLILSQNFQKDDSGACYGDSGGPTFYSDAAGEETLVAVTSAGDGGCMSMGFKYRIDIPSSLKFIQGVIATLVPAQ